ncbi:autotransporter outer membrane beta-barrel domain-containing protein [Kluyvera sp. STS39-E]|uniref:autotransporter outer membrane beta-barrel domain-containing protein n=1 Tax=Kluyvera sp. STS39-E TaxID=3234748 RepID=UPI0034C67A14
MFFSSYKLHPSDKYMNASHHIGRGFYYISWVKMSTHPKMLALLIALNSNSLYAAILLDDTAFPTSEISSEQDDVIITTVNPISEINISKKDRFGLKAHNNSMELSGPGVYMINSDWDAPFYQYSAISLSNTDFKSYSSLEINTFGGIGIRSYGSVKGLFDNDLIIRNHSLNESGYEGTPKFVGIRSVSELIYGPSELIFNKGVSILSNAPKSYGIYIQNGAYATTDLDHLIFNDIVNIVFGGEDSIGVYAEDRVGIRRFGFLSGLSDNIDYISFKNGLNVNVANGYAIKTTLAGSAISVAGKSNIVGDIYAGNDGLIELMLTSQSSVVGNMNNHNEDYSINGRINVSLSEGSVWSNQGDSFINDLLLNNSVLNFLRSDDRFNTVVVEGDFLSHNGVINFNTVLGSDNSATDKLIIKGNTAGNATVYVNNVGGQGAEVINGIELIHVDGDSAGEFIQGGRIVAGAWDYSLRRGYGSNDKNWYLVNNSIAPMPQPQPTPNARPEGGSYIANLAAANRLFNVRLHDRSGETWYQDPVTGEAQVTSLWLRQVGSHSKFRDGSGQLKTQGNSYVAQLGGDLAQWSTNGSNEGHLGLMAGYANSHSSTTSSRTGYGSKGSLNGYSIGMYGTWFEDKKNDAGLYLDSWLQYSWFNNSISGEGLSSESYKSKGLTASMETGYTQKLGEIAGSHGSVNEWFIQPQAQLTWMGVKSDDHRETNGTVVKGQGDGNVQTRLGVRTFLKGHHAMDAGTGRSFEPFVEANWLHNSRSFGSTMDGTRIHQAGSRNLGEVKAGVEAKLSHSLNLWGNVGTQLGTRGYMDSSAMVGVKINF